MSRSIRYSILVLGALLCLHLLRHLPSRQGRDSQQVFSSFKQKDALFVNATSLSLSPGELPGYTGWGRPAFTLAGYFDLLNDDNGDQRNEEQGTGTWTTETGSSWSILFQCRGHALCQTSKSLFFVRAYGPAILTGRVEPVQPPNNQGSLYRATLEPVLDPGTYTVEIVVTFSNPPAIDDFPLTTAQTNQSRLLYEGYLLPGMPLTLHVRSTQPGNSNPKLPLCKVSDLTIRHVDEGISKGRWKVTDMNRYHHPHTTTNSTIHDEDTGVTLNKYQQSQNSLGVTLSYQFRSCKLMPPPTPTVNPLVCVFQKKKKDIQTLHIVLIGDSVMELQYHRLNEYMQNAPSIQVEYVNIYGGYFRTQLQTGPKLRPLLKQSEPGPNTQRIIVFNTGLHDIHRLCHDEYATERKSYLRPDMLTSSCASLYRWAVLDFYNAIHESLESHAQTIAIFQTMTAAWPKYGNWGIQWDPRYGQPLPLDSSFIHHLNRIAIETLQPHLAQPELPLYLVDNYWSSLARPDNREISIKSQIGKKLAHPGVEVSQLMVDTINSLILQLLCG